MNTQILLTLLALGYFVLPIASQQISTKCDADVIYENKNQSDPKPLLLKSLSGQVTLEAGNPAKSLGPATDACLGLFDEEGHKLVKFATTDSEGVFQFADIQSGKYRLVVHYANFCVANVPIVLISKSRVRNKALVVHMRPASFDGCSYAGFK